MTDQRETRGERSAATTNRPAVIEDVATMTTPAPKRRVAKPRAATAGEAHAPLPGLVAGELPAAASRKPAPTRTKRTRESSNAGLAALPDRMIIDAAGLRRALLNRPFDEAIEVVLAHIAAALAPAVAQVWLPDASPLAGETGNAGGQELASSLSLRACAIVATPVTPSAESEARSHLAGLVTRTPTTADPFVDEVAAARRPLVLNDADTELPGKATLGLLAVRVRELGISKKPEALATLAGYPLRTRGQFLGMLVVGATVRLDAHQLALLEELADVAALAADRDHLSAYSRSKEALAQAVVRQAPVAIAVLHGPDHVFALANPTFSLLLGVDSAADLTGRSLREVVRERAESLAASLRLQAVALGGEPQVMIELPLRHIDRGMTYWNVTSTPLPMLAEGGGGVLVAAVDVTRQVVARQRSQETAEVAQERIAQMMTLHATSLAVASQLGADPRELLADILRRSIALLNGRAGAVYVRDARRDDLEVIVSQGLRGDYIGSRIAVGIGLAGRVAQTGQGSYVDDYRAYAGRAAIYGEEDFSAVIAVPLIQRGQVVGVLDILDDAERRAFTEDDLWLLELFAAQAAQAIENARTYVELERAYRKQRDLDRMKDDFIATASHELRTPLTGVQGFLDLLVEFPGSRDEPLALDFLQQASASAQELAEISERLLQTSRLDTGRIGLHLVRVRLTQVVEEALRSFRALQVAQGGTHELLSEVSPDLYVRADLGRLKEVLDNLVGNAIKYSPKGGTVVVSCAPANFTTADEVTTTLAPRERIEERPTEILPLLAGAPDPAEAPRTPSPAVISAAAERPYIVINVRDEGMGIPVSEQGRLFGRFARTEEAKASQIRGTGLGLYICRQILRAMDGDIWLEQRAPGQGSTFTFALPEAQPRAPSQGEREGLWPELPSR
jgi:signal transduction histidine kinase